MYSHDVSIAVPMILPEELARGLEERVLILLCLVPHTSGQTENAHRIPRVDLGRPHAVQAEAAHTARKVLLLVPIVVQVVGEAAVSASGLERAGAEAVGALVLDVLVLFVLFEGGLAEVAEPVGRSVAVGAGGRR